jgi:catechol 2,3-dioxygenase-like lactoylglutathione lyase family enzyme
MYDHVGLKVSSLDTSAQFYAAALKELGHAVLSRDETSVGLGAPEGAAGLWLAAGAAAVTPVHLAFTARTRSAVDAFHRAGLAARGRDNGAPGLRKDYGPSYYAAFLLDPDGNNVEAVCLK